MRVAVITVIDFAEQVVPFALLVVAKIFFANFLAARLVERRCVDSQSLSPTLHGLTDDLAETLANYARPAPRNHGVTVQFL